MIRQSPCKSLHPLIICWGQQGKFTCNTNKIRILPETHWRSEVLGRSCGVLHTGESAFSTHMWGWAISPHFWTTSICISVRTCMSKSTNKSFSASLGNSPRFLPVHFSADLCIKGRRWLLVLETERPDPPETSGIFSVPQPRTALILEFPIKRE